jgi:nitroreductase
MDITEALYTTRAMRRVTTQPIPEDVIARILDAAVRAPSGGNTQRWRFLLVSQPEIKARVQSLYRVGLDELNRTKYAATMDLIANGDPDDPEVIQAKKTNKSANWLADHLAEVPLLLFAFGKPKGESSIYPALWSVQLAARAEGIGSALTTLLFQYYRAETLAILGAPDDGVWEPFAMLSMGYPTGRWDVAKRQPAHEVVFQEQWGQPVTWSVPTPLFSY